MKIKQFFQMNTIKKRLYLIYVGLLFIPIILVGYYISVEIRSNQIDTKIEEIEQNTIRTTNDLIRTFELIIRVSDWIYQDERLAQIVGTQFQNIYDVVQTYENYSQFSDYIKYYPEIDYLRFYTDNPTLLSSVGFHPVTPAITSTAWYQDTIEKRGQIVWRMIEDPITREKNLNLTRSVFRNNQFIGVVTIAVSTDEINQMLANSGNSTFLTLDNNLIFNYTSPESPEEVSDYYRLLALEGDRIDLNHANSEEESIQGTGNQLTFTVQPVPLNKSLISHFEIVGTVPTISITREANRVLVTGYLIIGFVFLISLLILTRFIQHFNRRVLLLKESMTKVSHGDFDIPNNLTGNDEITDIYQELRTTMGSLQTLLEEGYQYEIDQKNWQLVKKDAEFKLLASQINPHFLYNTLEMIRMKALKNKDPEVAETVKILSKLMRKALERDREEMTLNEDLAFIEMYLQIQKLRLGERLTYRIHIQTTKEYMILPLLIQPIIENAFIHGVEKVSGPVRVSLEVLVLDRDIAIVIRDNGRGISADKLADLHALLKNEKEAKRIGISNVQQRIQHYYGVNYGLTISSEEGKGTEVTILLPQKMNEKGEQ
ncbi:cache domain-containing sensor histidine kinase [Fundicoccus sp. Sow4_F4]|uniref:cache domain-containing sensor histidine kinase n=1 Tax=Fundicoccus sp. Sow4_F4 TaxID=3438783 RepID=UPI003F9184A1